MGHKEKKLLKEILSFNIVGAVNTAITFGLYSLMVAFGIDYRAALVLEYCFGIVFSFVFNRKYTFRHEGPVTAGMVLSMAGSYLAVLGLNFILLVALVEKLGWNEYLGQLLALGISVVFSFFAQKYFVFHKRGA